MNIKEYNKIKDLNYFEYCNYLNSKYKDRSKLGLFRHHYYEYRKANLSNNEVAKQSTEEERNTIIYCNFLEHLFLHILIGEQTDSRLALGLGGAVNYIIPQINKYLDFDTMDYSPKYYENIDKDVFQLLCERCNKCINETKIALEHNNQLYLEVEQTLNNKGKALVVLGTGLGKTTTALQYLWNNKCRALVIGPNKLIKSGWEEYTAGKDDGFGWVDTTTYQSFANRYLDIDYSKYGLVILDEAHHAGFDEEVGRGAEIWGKGIKYLIDNNVVKVLGLTATPNRSDNIDIGNTLFEDCVCEGYAVEDGIEKGLIYPFDYITALYNTEELVEEYKDCDNRELVGQLDLALQKSLTLKDIFYKYMPTDVKRKGIIFIQDIKDEQYVKDIMSNCYPNIEYRSIHSKMNKEDVNRNREWFENADEGYLLAVNMISEGAHYKGVNTLIMFRKTSSYLVYTQQLGRIITLTKNENPNAIVFDLVNNIDSIEYSNGDNEDKRYQIHKIIDSLRKSPIKSKQIIIADESRDIVEAIKNIKDWNKPWSENEKQILIDYYNKNKNTKINIEPLLILLPKKSRSQIINEAVFLGLSKKKNKWTEDEIKILKEFYASEGTTITTRLLSRTKQQVLQMASKLNLKYSNPKTWSEDEIQILKNNYAILGKKCIEFLPNRTIAQIQGMASSLNIIYNGRGWSQEQKDIILKEYSSLGGKKLKDKYPELFEHKKEDTINTYAKSLGLKMINAQGQKSVICIELDKTFRSVKEAQEFIGAGSVCGAIKSNSTCGGYHWCYANDIDAISKLSHFKGKQPLSKSEIYQNNKYSKKVLCVETGVVYKSLADVRRKEGLCISNALKNPNKTCGGYHWKYVEEGDENKDE